MTNGVINGDAVTLIIAFLLVVIVFRLTRHAFDRLFQAEVPESQLRELRIRLALSEAVNTELSYRQAREAERHREELQHALQKISAMAESAVTQQRVDRRSTPEYRALVQEPVPQDSQQCADSCAKYGVLPYATVWEAADDIVTSLGATSLDNQLESAFTHIDELTRRTIQRSSFPYPEIILILRALDEVTSERFAQSLDVLVSRLQRFPLRTALYGSGVYAARRSEILESSGELDDLDPNVASSAPTLVSRYGLRKFTRFAAEFSRLRQLSCFGPHILIIAADTATAERARECAGRRIVTARVDSHLVAGFQLRTDVGEVDESLRTRILSHFEYRTRITTL